MKKILFVLFVLITFAGKAQDQFQEELSVFSFDFSDNLGRWQLKNLENSFKKTKNGLFVAETEVTNQQYNYFLSDLLFQKNYDLLLTCKVEKTDWRALLPEKYKNFDDKIVFPHGHPDMPYFPAQNMSFEAAQYFCNWLTDYYNTQTAEKRKWKKVRFRLPTEAEWVVAARGNKREDAKYCWGSDIYRNEKGCFLSNFDCSDEPCEKCKLGNNIARDGGVFPVRADAYYPNDFGLYGITGNVAEMITTKGIAKGGSWEDKPTECTIFSQKKYEKPMPSVGFRLFLEIIE